MQALPSTPIFKEGYYLGYETRTCTQTILKIKKEQENFLFKLSESSIFFFSSRKKHKISFRIENYLIEKIGMLVLQNQNVFQICSKDSENQMQLLVLRFSNHAFTSISARLWKWNYPIEGNGFQRICNLDKNLFHSQMNLLTYRIIQPTFHNTTSLIYLIYCLCIHPLLETPTEITRKFFPNFLPIATPQSSLRCSIQNNYFYEIQFNGNVMTLYQKNAFENEKEKFWEEMITNLKTYVNKQFGIDLNMLNIQPWMTEHLRLHSAYDLQATHTHISFGNFPVIPVEIVQYLMKEFVKNEFIDQKMFEKLIDQYSCFCLSTFPVRD